MNSGSDRPAAAIIKVTETEIGKPLPISDSTIGGNKKGTEKGPEKIVSMLNLNSSKIVENKGKPTFTPEDAKNENQINDFCEKLSEAVLETIEQDKLPVILGGDHSISIGSISAVSQTNDNTGLIWIDAHADFNTPETSPSGNIHGMSVATAVGRSRFSWGEADLEEENIVLVGVRDTDEKEQKNLEESKVTVYTIEEVKEKGIEKVVEEIMGKLSNVEKVHISFDLDYLDANEVPGVGIPVENGGKLEDTLEIVRKVDQENKLQSLDIVELNPELDEGDKTASKAVKFIERSLFETKTSN